jgi:hypothetical protein
MIELGLLLCLSALRITTLLTTTWTIQDRRYFIYTLSLAFFTTR